MPDGGELRFPMSIPRGDIGIQLFEIGRGGRQGRSCGDLPNTVSFVFVLSFVCFFLSYFSFVLSFVFP